MKVNGKEVKVIKEYENFYLVEFPAGYRECIDKSEIKPLEKTRKPIGPKLKGE